MHESCSVYPAKRLVLRVTSILICNKHEANRSLFTSGAHDAVNQRSGTNGFCDLCQFIDWSTLAFYVSHSHSVVCHDLYFANLSTRANGHNAH